MDTFLLKAHILSHSIMVTAREEPWATMNSLRPSTVIPRRSTPRTVGNRGSSLPMGVQVSERKCRLSRPHPPSTDQPLVHKPGQLPLGENRVLQVESAVLINVRLPELWVAQTTHAGPTTLVGTY